MTKVQIGNVEVLAIQDCSALMSAEYMFPSVAAQFNAEYGHLRDERGLMPMSITTFVLRSAGKTILIDTGVGPRRRNQLPRGRLDAALEQAGIAPEEVDVVLNTHLHVDHVGWNTVDDENGRRIFFPNARWFVQRVEWDHWMRPEHMNEENPHLEECVLPIKDRVTLIDGEQAFDENLTFLPTPGHTPGHAAIGIFSGGERAIIVGDASHHPAQIDHPDWSPHVDSDPVQSAETRDKLFESAAADGRVWIAGHWVFPGIGQIVRLDGKRVFRAL